MNKRKEKDVQQAHLVLMVRCAHTLGHTGNGSLNWFRSGLFETQRQLENQPAFPPVLCRTFVIKD